MEGLILKNKNKTSLEIETITAYIKYSMYNTDIDKYEVNLLECLSETF